MTQKTYRTGRRRWASLVRFLTEQMQGSKSERVRMQAALRLADILTLREEREIDELKAAARAEAVTVPVNDPEPAKAVQTPEPPEDTSKEVFAAIMNKARTDATV